MVAAINFVGGAVGLYRIVPVNEAHVRILFGKRKLFMNPRNEMKVRDVEKEMKADYWFIPFTTKVHKLPLTNIRIDVPDIKLNDSNMAKFLCDIVCFVNIDDPTLCAERTEITVEDVRYEGIKSIVEDLRAIMEGTSRTVATQQTILDIYKNREKLDNAVTKELDNVFPKWGLKLVDLEIKDLKDVPGSTIIQDIEKKQAAVINADARVMIATESRRAAISEAENQRAAEFRRAEMDQEWQTRRIQKDREVAIAEQEKNQKSEEKRRDANIAQVEANRKLNVGMAEIEKERMVQIAEGVKAKVTREAEGNAAKIKIEGEAEGTAIRAKKVGDAEGTEKQAVAQQKFNDAATGIELIHANRDIGLAYAAAYGKGLENAQVNIVSNSLEPSKLLKGGILGDVSLGATEGVALQQFLKGLGKDDLKNITSLLASMRGGEGKEGAK